MFGRFADVVASCILAVVIAGPVVITPSSAAAQTDRITLGWGRLFTNDALGDGRDRWRTGSYTISRIRGPEWTGILPASPGKVLEFRIRAETMAPADLVDPDEFDRRYAGLIGLGLHTHFALNGLETSAGVDLVVTGQQTGLGRFQRHVHNLLDMPRPQVLGDQIGDGFYLHGTVELGQSIPVGGATFRPFVELQAGTEDLIRAGADVSFGAFGKGALLVRENVTGHRYRAVPLDRVAGYSFTLGGDTAVVYDSLFIPEGGAAVLSDRRSRLRAGLHWQGQTSEVFYGITWMGQEFEQQPAGQLLGSVNLRLRF